MPRQTERQQAAEEIHNRFFTDIIVEIVSQLQEDEDRYDNHSDSSSSSKDSGMDTSSNSASSSCSHSSSSLSSSSSDPSMMDQDSDSDSEESLALAQYIMDIENLYATRNLHQHVPIPKSSALLDLLLSSYKVDHPEIFRSYLCIYPACFDWSEVKYILRHAVLDSFCEVIEVYVLPQRVLLIKKKGRSQLPVEICRPVSSWSNLATTKQCKSECLSIGVTLLDESE